MELQESTQIAGKLSKFGFLSGEYDSVSEIGEGRTPTVYICKETCRADKELLVSPFIRFGEFTQVRIIFMDLEIIAIERRTA